MNCPKCGYAQEQRLDCKKCGVVFSKYLALFRSARPAEGMPATDAGAPEPPDHDIRLAFAELQATVKALHSRFAEIEFEKAERNQLRTDLKNLERQLHENAAQLGSRLEQCEQRPDKPSVPQIHHEALDFEIPAIHDRLENVEDRMRGLELAGQYITEMREKQEACLSRASELESQIADLRGEIADIRGALQAQEPRTPLEEDVHVIRKNLEDLRQLLNRNT